MKWRLLTLAYLGIVLVFTALTGLCFAQSTARISTMSTSPGLAFDAPVEREAKSSLRNLARVDLSMPLEGDALDDILLLHAPGLIYGYQARSAPGYLDLDGPQLMVSTTEVDLLDEAELVVQADLNGDGRPDYVIGQRDPPRVLIYLSSEGPERYRRSGDSPIEPELAIQDIAAGDFDGDGNQDVAILYREDVTVDFYQNDGQGVLTLTSTATHPDGMKGSIALAATDLNHDKQDDLVIVSGVPRRTAALHVVRNVGEPDQPLQLVWKTEPLIGSDPSALALADVNDDAVPDIVVAARGVEARAEIGIEVRLGGLEDGAGSAYATGQLVRLTPGGNAPLQALVAGRFGEGDKIHLTAARSGRGRAEVLIYENRLLEGDGSEAFDLVQRVPLRDDVQVGGMVAAHLNADKRLDLALADRAQNQLMVVRGQPRPCATFVTVATHGHGGEHSIVHPLFPIGEFSDYDRFTEALAGRVTEMNAVRRPGQPPGPSALPDLCPVRYLGLTNHWETLTADGATLHAIGRTGWLLSSYLTGVPQCMQPLVWPGPGVTPLDYWGSYLWLVITRLIPPPCMDFDILARMALMGVGAGAEGWGRARSGDASRRATKAFFNELEEATEEARQGMDLCSGQLYMDLMAYSRGATVTSEMLRSLAARRAERGPLRFNTKVTFTVIAGIDPTPDDAVRPWVVTGHFVGDPLIERVGNELISTFHEARPIVPTGVWAFFGSFLDGILTTTENFVLGTGVGLPIGRDRSTELQAFRFSRVNRSHGEIPLPFLNLENFPGTCTSCPQNFTFARTSKLGGYLVDENAMRGPMTDEVGWHPFAGAGPDEEAEFLPEGCPGASPDDGSTTTEPVASTASLQRDLLRDPRFLMSRAMIENADRLQDRKDLTLADASLKFFHDYLRETAKLELPLLGVWEGRGGSRPRIRGEVDPVLNLQRALARVALGVGVSVQTDPMAAQQHWTSVIENMDKAQRVDLAHLLRQMASGASATEDAYADFTQVATLSQSLDIASLNNSDLFGRLVVEFTHPQGELRLLLTGQGLDHQEHLRAADHGVAKRIYQAFHVQRDPTAVANSSPDQATFKGSGVRVYRISIHPQHPLPHPTTGHFYELVLHDGGISWEHAHAFAQRSRFQGKIGELATLQTREELEFILKHFDLRNVHVWLGGVVKPSAQKGHWITGQPFDLRILAEPYLIDDKAEGVRHVFLGPGPRGSDLELRAAGPATQRASRPFGYLVMYR